MTRHPRILDRSNSVLLVIDVQERFRKILGNADELAAKINILVKAAGLLQVPVVVTEQYPRGLGETFAEIRENLIDYQYFEKDCFSACGVPDFLSWLAQSGRRQIIVSGIEAHICVCQTSHDLIQEGFDVHLAIDAIDSRFPANKEIGVKKMLLSGAIPTCVETALFEMLVESGTETFKAVQKLIM